MEQFKALGCATYDANALARKTRPHAPHLGHDPPTIFLIGTLAGRHAYACMHAGRHMRDRTAQDGNGRR